MKINYKSVIVALVLALSTNYSNAQVLISLLLGDKLNSDKLEFGLDGGINYLTMTNTKNAKFMFDWNLGFYFDFKLKDKLFIHTGVLVKSKMGAKNLDPYPLGNPNLDTLFTGASLERKINYFNVPGLVRYRPFGYFHVEGGIQAGLRYTGFDLFTNSVNDDDLIYKNDIKDDFTRLDFGFVGGVGYKFSKGKGMTLGVKYYYGVVDVNKADEGSQYNNALYINASIAIGKGKAQAKAAEKNSKQ